MYCYNTKDSFTIARGDKILLVGEGNFSFSIGLIKLNEDVFSGNDCSIKSSTEIISTCFECDDALFENKLKNIGFLREKGCIVLRNVDATSLQRHPIIGSKKFTKVIFNFPHVGGKMKIHLNRKLLLDFFLSVKHILEKDGVVLVTLCDGQGGTGADKSQRRWDDSWKIVEMAAEAELVLNNIYPFVCDNFPDYINIGYRSLQKGFNAKNALVHVLKLGKPLQFPDISNSQLFELQSVPSFFGNLNISKVYAQKIFQDQFNLENSPLKYIMDCIKNISFSNEICFIEENIIYGYGTSSQYSSGVELIEKHFPEVIGFGKSINIFKGYLLSKLTRNFGIQPVSCEVLCVGEKSKDLAVDVIHELTKSFKYQYIELNCAISNDNNKVFCLDGWIKIDVFKVSSFVKSGVTYETCTIFLENIAKFFFCFNDWQELWAEGTVITEYGDKKRLLTPCLFPCLYTFDLSFSVIDTYSEDKFLSLLWHIAGNIIFSVELISTYEPLKKNLKNFCYRIKYKSYEVPLCRKRAIDFQRSGIGKALKNILNAIIL